MNIFELLSFDIVEFVTSVEGILIIVGILFLIIGIVLLCMGKGKKKEAVSETTDINTSVAIENIPKTPVVNDSPVITQETPKVEIPVVSEPELVQSAPTVLNNTSEATPIVVPSTTDGLQESATAPVVEPINFTEETKNDNVEPESLGIDNIVDSNKTEELNVSSLQTEKVDAAVDSNLNDVSVVKGEPTVTVYGGTNPETVIKKENLEEKPREIYGGANPLENTAPIPTNTVREAYSGGIVTPTTLVSEPKVESVPVVETNTEPVLNEPVITETAETVTTPDVSQSQNEVSAPIVSETENKPENKINEKEEIEKLEF